VVSELLGPPTQGVPRSRRFQFNLLDWIQGPRVGVAGPHLATVPSSSAPKIVEYDSI